MRVLMTADTVGGVWTYAVELARALADRDGAVALVAIGSPLREDQRAALNDMPHVTSYELPGRLEWMDDPWDDVEASQRELRRIADDFGPDLIHANSYCHAAMEWEVPVLLVAHSRVVSWFAEVRGETPGPEWNRYRRTIRQALDAADRIVAPTAAMLRFLERCYGPVGSTKVIPNGIGRSGDHALGDASLLASKERAVFAAGRMWDEAKNLVAVYLLQPIADLSLTADIYGVRYPPEAIASVEEAGAQYRGWLANFDAPQVFADHRATVHVPRRPYRESLVGIPTIRVFEALVCGIPLVSMAWDDCEGLFRPGEDYLVVRSGREMTDRLRDILQDESLARSLARSGVETIRAKHTCAHRVDELLAICPEIGLDAPAKQKQPVGRNEQSAPARTERLA